jgi:hypothetical protein
MERRNGPRSSFRGFGSPLVREGWFPYSGYHGGVQGESFGRRDVLDCANPTLIGAYQYTLFVLTLVLSRLFAHVHIFEFQVGDLKNIWLIDSVLMVKFRQPIHEFTFGVGMSFISYPLLLTPLI